MSNQITYRQSAWFGDDTNQFIHPDNWQVTQALMKDAPALTKDQLEYLLNKPIGSPALTKLASSYSSAVILCEDHTRPLKLSFVLECLLDMLNLSGIPDEHVRIIIANGTHRPLSRAELIMKLGNKIIRRVPVFPHNCYDNLRHLGTTSNGTPLEINAAIYPNDLIIGVSGVYPHGMAGFSGGAKIILPGVSGINSIEHNHRYLSGRYLDLDCNGFRKDMEEAAILAGLNFSVNMAVNGNREICILVAGDFIQAHREACKQALDVYTTHAPNKADLLLINAYPMDSELFQAAKSLEIIKQYPGTQRIILMASCDEGFGHHWLCGPGGRLHSHELANVRNILSGKRLYICSKGISRHDVLQKFPMSTMLFETPEQVFAIIEAETSGNALHAIFFPSAPIQVVYTFHENCDNTNNDNKKER